MFQKHQRYMNISSTYIYCGDDILCVHNINKSHNEKKKNFLDKYFKTKVEVCDL